MESIKPNEVGLSEDGKTVTLRANSNRFLDTSVVSNRGGTQFNRGSEDTSPENKKRQEGKPENRGNREWSEDRMRNIAERFRNASPEERERMREEFRRGREGRGRGRARDGTRDSGRRRD